MRWLRRFFRELRHPELKCARVGHKVKVGVWVSPEGYHSLFFHRKQDARCKRCHTLVRVYGWIQERCFDA